METPKCKKCGQAMTLCMWDRPGGVPGNGWACLVCSGDEVVQPVLPMLLYPTNYAMCSDALEEAARKCWPKGEYDAQVIALARYHDYKRGWCLGAQGRSELEALGTPVPDFIEEWRRGFEDGNRAFNQAMAAQFRRIGGKRV